MCVYTKSCLALFDPMDVARQAPLFVGFSRQEYWSGLPFPSPGDLPNPGMEPVSPASPALAGGFFTTGPPAACQTDMWQQLPAHLPHPNSPGLLSSVSGTQETDQ